MGTNDEKVKVGDSVDLDLQVSYNPTPIYEDIQLIIYIIKANHNTNTVKHIAVPIQSVHEKIYITNYLPC